MNFHAIFHLLKTDWQRLRWLILGTWAIIFLAALPWLLHDPESFTLPWTEAAEGNDGPQALQGMGWQRAVAGATLLVATAIGMHDFRWQRVTPIRGWERLAAKVLAVLLFIVVPQVLLGMAVMWKQEYSIPVILGAAAGIALSLALLHGTAAVFGRQCGSFWIWAPAVACLAGAAYLPLLLTRFFPKFLAPLVPALWSLSLFLDAWAETSGLLLWVYLGLALAAAAGMPRLLRTRPGTIPATFAAIGGLLLAGVAAPWISPRPKPPQLDMPALRPTIAPGDFQISEVTNTGISGRTSYQTHAEARITTKGGAIGKFVRWMPYPANFVDYPSANKGIMQSAAGATALSAVLPAPLAATSTTSHEMERLLISVQQGTTMSLTGIVFHYETLSDLQLSETPAVSTKENATAIARLNFDSSSGPLPELILRFASRRVFPNGLFPFNDSFAFALYLPKQNVCVQMRTKVEQSTPVPGGAICVRYVLGLNDGRLDRSSLAGARIIIVRPVIEGILKRQLEMPPVPQPDWERKGGRLDQGTRITEADYLTNFRPNRPDPATCTEDEFDRYLQAICNTWPGSLLKDDLAEYAPRFPQVLARYLSSRNVAYALGEILPESAKVEVISAIRTPREALQAAELLARRGWQDEARGPLRECLGAPFMAKHGGEVYPVIVALAELENPAIYPALVATYENGGRSYYYQIIRPLPGIKPLLDAAVERISGKLKTSLLEFTSFSSVISDALETYEAPVSHGNATALGKLLKFWEILPFESISELDEAPPPDENKDDPDKQPQYSVMASGDVGGSAPKLVLKDFTRFFRIDPPIPHKLAAWRAFLAGKTAADFTYDPLARRWRASSLTK